MVFLFFDLNPKIPELLLFFIGGFFMLYTLIISIKESWRDFFIFSFKSVNVYMHLFFVGFVFSFIFYPVALFFENSVLIFFAIFIFHFLFSKIFSNEIFNRKPFNLINYRNFSFLLFFILFFLNKFDLIINSIFFGGFYVILHLLYSVIFSAFTQEISILKLSAGMFPAEQITKKGNVYKKTKSVYLSPQYYLRSFMLKKIEHAEDVIKPTKALSKGDIIMIQNIAKAYGFNTFKIQRCIDMRFFVFLGILGTLSYVFI